MNLLFSIDRNFRALLLSCLHSIALRGGADSYDAYILHSDLLPRDEDFLRAAAEECITLHFIPVPTELFEGFPTSKRYPVQIYYRLAAAHVLPAELERILYLDVDTIVINPLTPLYDVDFGNNLFAACTHTRAFLEKFNQLRLNTEKDVPYVNTGIMMMDLPRMRRELDLNAIREYGLAHQHQLVLPDQDILTALYGDRVKIVDTLRYNLSDRTLSFYNADPLKENLDLDWVRNNAVIIHYFGKNKPWKPNYKGILGTFYREYGLPLAEWSDSP